MTETDRIFISAPSHDGNAYLISIGPGFDASTGKVYRYPDYFWDDTEIIRFSMFYDKKTP